MNFKKQAEKLEKFLEDEFSKKIPVVILSNKDILYRRFKIHKNNDGTWAFCHITGDTIDKFYLKATALLAAKFYDVCRFDRYNEVKNLDTGYWNNSLDSIRFLSRANQTSNIDKKILFTARNSLTSARAEKYKLLISSMFRNNF